MNDAEAKAWLNQNVSRETFAKVERLVALLRMENERHNLVSAATLESVWARHIVDSAQLVAFSASGRSWVDLGSGAGFPGLVVALLHSGPVTLVESRRLRAEFLAKAADQMEVEVEIVQADVRRVEGRTFDVISARAFAPLPRLFELAAHLATPETIWVLPKGRSAQSELDAVRGSWQGEFRLEPSVTDEEARILVARGVERSKGRRQG